MKKFEHLYIDLKHLKEYVQVKKLTDKLSAQIYCLNEAEGSRVSQELLSINNNTINITLFISSSYKQTKIDFVPLNADTVVIPQTPSLDHELLYTHIINITTEGFWLLDDNLKIVDVNDSLCNMLGYKKTEMIGKKPFSFLDVNDHEFCKVEQSDLVDNIVNRIYEINFKTKSGKLIYILTNSTTMLDYQGKMKTFAFMTDISTQKKIEDDLESRITQEVEKNREKDRMMYQQSRLASMGEMIGNIAHQWRQPLNIMALVMQDIYISDQLGNLTSKKVEESYDKSNNLLQYMSQTIDDFRNFFKQDNEKIEFSIKEAIDSIYNLVGTNLSYKQIEFKIDVEHDSKILGGLNEFKQVLINIINNAQEAIESNGSQDRVIEIKITQYKDNAQITISDDGGGISKDVIDKIFDPYFTTKKRTQGTGLGLYMSKQIVENLMCGSLSVRNIKKGTEFKITFPFNTCF